MEKHSNSQSNPPVKTREEMAGEFNIHPRTLSRWLKRDGIELDARILTPKCQEIIYRQYGNPNKEERDGWER